MLVTLRNGLGEMRLRYLHEDVDRHGNVRVYFRRFGRQIRLRATPGTDAFLEEYNRAASAIAAAESPQSPSTKSLKWLVEQYYRSAEFRRLKRGNVRRRILDTICEKCGNEPAGLMLPRHVRLLRDERADKPEAANARVKALRQVFGWGKEMGYVASNPAKEVAYIKRDSEGFHTWTPEEVLKYDERHLIGTKARLAMDLLLYTGVRRSDVVRLGRQMERAGALSFTETKGRDRRIKQRTIPILPALRASIDATPSGQLTYVVTEFGKPFTANGFGNRFKKWCRDAGIAHCSAHGLRKAGATLAAERGATDRQLMALFGWENPKQASVYTRKADQAKLTAAAVKLLAPEQKSDAVSPPTRAMNWRTEKS